MSFRAWLSVVTFILIGVVLFLARHEFVQAWQLLQQVNVWILLLLVPLQIFVYYTGGEMIFSYLRSKGRIKEVSRGELAAVALEGNFVNHVLPSGGVSGVSYLTWRLRKLGVSSGSATMAQVVRYAMGFVSFSALLLIALLLVTIDGGVNRWIIFTSAVLIGGMAVVIAGGVYLLSSKRRTETAARWTTRALNSFVRRVTFGRKRTIIARDDVDEFFAEMHRDFRELNQERKLLVRPFWWGVAYTAGDVAMFWVTFLALGELVNPAPVLIAYGVASMAGFFVLTPGGAGAYEALMVMVLAFAGIASGTAIAAIVLTRIILLVGTIVMGYVFYQRALLKYGKRKPAAER